jgi:transposase InsO family protein
MGVRPSMGTVGDAYDNAMAESFFATLECELIDRRSWPTKTEARMAYGPPSGPESSPQTQRVSGCLRADPDESWWALKDSNLRPTD